MTSSEFNTVIKNEIDNILKVLSEDIFNSKIFLIMGNSDFPLIQLNEILSSQELFEFSFKSVKDFSLEKILEIQKDESLKFLYTNCLSSSFEYTEAVNEVVMRCHEIIIKRGDICPVLLINDFVLTNILNYASEKDIPKHIFKTYKLGTIDEDLFTYWLREQFPCYLDTETLNILIHGTGKDFSKAIKVRNAFFENEKTQLFFLTKDNIKVDSAIFKIENDTSFLRAEDGQDIRMPVHYFLFDTSAILSPHLPSFLKYLGSYEWIYPKIVMNEVHKFEETSKREDKGKSILLKQNLDLLLKIEPKKHYNSKMNMKDVDIKLIGISKQTGSIIVTCDKMLFKNSKLSKVPAILII